MFLEKGRLRMLRLEEIDRGGKVKKACAGSGAL